MQEPCVKKIPKKILNFLKNKNTKAMLPKVIRKRKKLKAKEALSYAKQNQIKSNH